LNFPEHRIGKQENGCTMASDGRGQCVMWGARATPTALPLASVGQTVSQTSSAHRRHLHQVIPSVS
jgi:hypothetical protein